MPTPSRVASRMASVGGWKPTASSQLGQSSVSSTVTLRHRGQRSICTAVNYWPCLRPNCCHESASVEYGNG